MSNVQNRLGETQGTPLFGAPPFSVKHSQDNFSLQMRFFGVLFEKRGEGSWASATGEDRPDKMRPNHFVYTSVSANECTPMSTRVRAFEGD